MLELDALRGIAALGVMIYHFTTNYGRYFGHTDRLWFSLSRGHYGVQLFFMISGFVILMTLDRTRTMPDFAIARFSRLFPAYWAAVITTFVVVSCFGLPGWNVSIPSGLLNLTMLHAFFQRPHVDGSYWTLHVELAFYVLMALIVGSGLRRHLIPIVTGLVLLDLVNHSTGVLQGWSGWWRFELLLAQLNAFLVGIIIYQARTGWRWRYALVLLVCAADVAVGHDWKHWVIVLCIGSSVFAATQRRIPWLTNRVFLFLGTISYSLYLIHQNIGYVIIQAGYRYGVNANVSILLALVVTTLLGSLLAFAVEKPSHRLLQARLKNWRTSWAEPLPVVSLTSAAD